MARLVAAVALVALALLATTTTTTVHAFHLPENKARALFASYKAKYGKSYATVDEENKRFGIFVQNLHAARAQRKLNPLARFGVNEFSDRSAEEFKVRHNLDGFLKKRREVQLPMHAPITAQELAAMPQTIDWRALGAVTPIKNQGECGSCYTFSTTGNIEGQWFLAGNPLVSLSEQELVSCDDIDDGCNGGFQDDAFIWLFFERKGVIATEASYPYVSGNGVVPPCKTTGLVAGATIVDYQDIARNEAKMAEHLSVHGPIAISLDATSFQTYTGGILTNCINQTIDHAVLIVGYDLSYSTPYWIIKNSWGVGWGESGYIRVAYGSDQCLLASMPTTAIASKNPNPTTTAAPTWTTAAPNTTTPAPTWTPAPTNTTPNVTTTSAPTPTPGNLTFIQSTCQDPFCIVGCTNATLPQNTCLQADDGSSAVATCLSPVTLQVVAYTSGDCSGSPASNNTITTEQCNIDDEFTFVEYYCPGDGFDYAAHAKQKVHAQKYPGVPSILQRRL